jgi:hypothetical protein
MITERAKSKARILVFWEKHGLEATLDAFSVKRPTLFLWKKKFKEGSSKIEALNNKKRVPLTRRKRIWPLEIKQKIRSIRDVEEHPNLGP